MIRALLAAALLLPAQEDEWPSFHGSPALDGRSGAALPDALARLWEFKAGQPIEAPPVYGDGRIYAVTVKDTILALDLAGRKAWSQQIKDDFFMSPPFYSAKAVFAGTGNGFLCAFDAATGAEKWKVKVGDTVMGTPNRIDLPDGRAGIVAVSQTDGALHGVELETGKPVWTAEMIDRCDGHPSAADGRVVFGSCAAALHVFTVGKEAARKDIPLADDGQVAGGAALSGKTAYAGTQGRKVYAVDVEAGRIVWKNDSAAGESFTTPAVGGRFVVFGSSDGKVYGLDRETGSKAWEFDTGDTPSSPVIAGDRVAVSSKGTLLILELATGRKVCAARVSDAITGPAVVRGLLVVGTDQGTVAAFGPGTPAPEASPPALSGMKWLAALLAGLLLVVAAGVFLHFRVRRRRSGR